MTSIAVTPGQKVSQGQVLGYSGDSGWSLGNHCHVEIIRVGNMSMSEVIYALSDFLIMILSWLVKQSLRAFLFQEVQP